MYWDYSCVDSIAKPAYYLIPQGWNIVIEKLKINQIKMEFVTADEIMNVSSYKIISYTSSVTPYEGHHLKRNVNVESTNLQKQFYKGDVKIKTGTRFDYFLASVLEPTGYDSYFAWGFFDSMLNQKEWFSDYVWEDRAYDILEKDSDLKKRFQDKKQSDTAFANSSWEQLYFIYKASPYFEESYMQYPVYKIYD